MYKIIEWIILILVFMFCNVYADEKNNNGVIDIYNSTYSVNNHSFAIVHLIDHEGMPVALYLKDKDDMFYNKYTTKYSYLVLVMLGGEWVRKTMNCQGSNKVFHELIINAYPNPLEKDSIITCSIK